MGEVHANCLSYRNKVSALKVVVFDVNRATGWIGLHFMQIRVWTWSQSVKFLLKSTLKTMIKRVHVFGDLYLLKTVSIWAFIESVLKIFELTFVHKNYFRTPCKCYYYKQYSFEWLHQSNIGECLQIISVAWSIYITNPIRFPSRSGRNNYLSTYRVYPECDPGWFREQNILIILPANVGREGEMWKWRLAGKRSGVHSVEMG